MSPSSAKMHIGAWKSFDFQEKSEERDKSCIPFNGFLTGLPASLMTKPSGSASRI